MADVGEGVGSTETGEPYDVLVIGGGVVGCAVARRFTLEGASVCLLEKATDILCSSASKGNSAILHTGFDAHPGSVEHACVQAGYQEYMQIAEKMNLPVLSTGAVVVAWTDDDAARLPDLVHRARANGVMDVEAIEPLALYEREPALVRGARGAVLVPGEHVIDPWSAPLAYLLQAVSNGADAVFRAQVLAAEASEEGWTLATTAGRFRGRVVINCAGLFGDHVDRLAGVETFEIRPRKGQFLVLDKSSAPLLGTIVLPVPTERTKGALIAPTVFGNLLIGPTAEDVDEREAASVDEGTLRRLLADASAKLPGIEDHDVTATFAGLRPATDASDYRVDLHRDRRWITAGGIRSTGLTASLGVASHVWDLFREGYESTFDHGFEPLTEPAWPTVANLAEHRERDHQRPGSGPVVCHCEMVTRREVVAALDGPLPARSLEALRRKTRAMLGRCQGFYCTGAIAELAASALPGAFGPTTDPTVRTEVRR